MIALCFCLIVFVSALEDGFVVTPFGVRRKECVLEVPDGALVKQVGSRLEITQTINGMQLIREPESVLLLVRLSVFCGLLLCSFCLLASL
jgi:hypothetical protein